MIESHLSKTHVFYAPTKIPIGLNSASQLANEIKQFGGSPVRYARIAELPEAAELAVEAVREALNTIKVSFRWK